MTPGHCPWCNAPACPPLPLAKRYRWGARQSARPPAEGWPERRAMCAENSDFLHDRNGSNPEGFQSAGLAASVFFGTLTGKSGHIRPDFRSRTGTLRRDRIRLPGGRHNRTHGEGGHGFYSVEYNAWMHMRQPCSNSKYHAYARYGGRGIKVCDRWRNSFEAFLADMSRRPSGRRSLDRINNNGDDEPSNCRWATPVQQSRNRGWSA